MSAVSSTGTSRRPVQYRAHLRARGDRWAAAVAAAVALVAVQLLLRGAIAGQGWFHLDDLVFMHRARTEPFDTAYLLRDHGGHLMPGAFALVSLLTTVVPPHWSVMAGIDLLAQALLDIALFRMLIELFGRRPAVLLPFAVFVTTSVTLPATIWWAAALNQLPMQLATVLALTAHVRYLRSGRVRHAVASALAVAAGLLFSEKTLTAVLLIVAVTLLWFVRGGPLARIRQATRRHRAAWLLLGTVAAAHLAVYLTVVTSPLRATPDLAALPGQIGAVLTRSVLPGLVGGPWTWRMLAPTLPTADPPAGLVVLAALATVLVVTASLVVHTGAGRAWLLFGGWLVVDVVLLAVNRGTVFDTTVLVREYRYVTDAAVVAALALGLAFLPVRGAPPVLRQRPGAWAERVRTLARPAPAAALAGVLVLGSVVSGAGYATGWRDNAARDFVTNAQAGLAAAPASVLVDAPVPDRVLWGLLAPENTAAVVLSGLPAPPRFLADGEAVVRPGMLDDAGRLVPAQVQPLTTGVPGPDGPCGRAVLDRPVPVPLQTALPDGRWLVRLGYLSAEDHLGWIEAGRQRAPILLPAGLHDAVAQVTGPVTTVTVTLRDPAGQFCVGPVEVGSARPGPG